MHEALHHAKHQVGELKEAYAPSCRGLHLAAALENADSYAFFALSLSQEGLQPSFTDCPWEWKVLMVLATRTAEIWTNGAMAALDALLTDPQHAGPRARQLLKFHFKIEPSAKSELTAVRESMAEIEAAFGRELPFECETECSPKHVTGYTGGFLGVFPRGGSLHLCPHWFKNLTDVERAETILHEIAHRYAGDEAYLRRSFVTTTACQQTTRVATRSSRAPFRSLPLGPKPKRPAPAAKP